MNEAVFLRILEPAPEDKGAHLASSIAALRTDDDCNDVFVQPPDRFTAIPNSPFAYWVGERIRRTFEEFPPLEGNGATAKVGLQTSDDFRFVRAWWEVDPERIGYSPEDTEQGRGWVHFAKGGSYSPYYADVHLLFNWFDQGTEIKAWAGSLYGGSHWSRIIKNVDYYFRPGLTWPRRSQKGLSVRALPSGCAFADKGPAILIDDPEMLLPLLGVVNSQTFLTLVEAQMAFGSYEVGVLQRTPVPTTAALSNFDATLVSQAYALHSAVDDWEETTHRFVRSALTLGRGDLKDRIEHVQATAREIDQSREQVQREVDTQVERLYGLSPEDSEVAQEEDREETDVVGDDVPHARLLGDLLSWCVGCVFGRWDARLANADQPAAGPGSIPDALPRSPIGCLERENRASPAYPVQIARDGILVDDRGHEQDVVGRVRSVLREALRESATEVETSGLEILRRQGRTPSSLRGWFRNQRAMDLGGSFFEFHISRYSKSRRKAPIYWRLCSSPGRGQSVYSVWLYYHRLTDDSLWRVLGDYVTPRRELEEQRLEEARGHLRSAEGSDARKLETAIETRTAFLEEVTWFEEELRRVADSGWAPNHDDGVLINMAPLHRLIPWSEPAKIWKKLEKGDYDWSHMAMRYWPERVLEKCRKNKSLAIAHGCLDLYGDV